MSTRCASHAPRSQAAAGATGLLAPRRRAHRWLASLAVVFALLTAELAADLTFGPVALAAIPKRLSDAPSANSNLSEVAQTEVAQIHSADVRVRLDRVKASVALSGFGLRIAGRPVTATSSASLQSVRITWVREAGTTAWTIEDRLHKSSVARVRSETLEFQGSNLRVNLKPAPSRLRLVPTQLGSADLIATMDLEEYVRGVLPSEMPASWPIESLKAQAVAARTFALFRKDAREATGGVYDLESTVMDQVFSAANLHDESVTRLKVDQAVSETRGVVLLDHQASPFATYFHADCGGRTEEPNQVWGAGRLAGTAVDESCPASPLARWVARVPLAQIAVKLRAHVNQPSAARLASLEAIERTDSGRVDVIKLSWLDGSTHTLSGHKFRMALGHDRVRSTNFAIHVRDSIVEFEGVGHGHGVGLCQWGARQLALKGKGYREILSHYYPKAMLSDAQPIARAGEALKAGRL